MQASNSPQHLSDEALVARVVLRDVDAFSLLYDHYARTVYALAAHMLDVAEAEDVVQEVFLRLWHKARLYSPERGSVGPWLLAIARHESLDRLARRSQQRRLGMADGVDRMLANAQDGDDSVEDQVWLRDSAQEALRALKTLPEEQRRVVVLAYFGGLSQSSIASYLGLPLGTVKKRIRLGLQKLRSQMQKAGADGLEMPRETDTSGDSVKYGL